MIELSEILVLTTIRPVGLAFDSQGRMFVSSDASGEVYVIARDQAANGTSASGTATGSAPTASTSTSGAGKISFQSLTAVLLLYIITFLLL